MEGKLPYLFIREAGYQGIQLLLGIYLGHLGLDLFYLVFPGKLCYLLSKFLGTPAEMHLQNLPHVHTGWHTQGIKDDVYRSSVLKVGHVFNRNDLGNNALVPVTSCHLVPHLELALYSHVDPDHLDHAWRKLIPLLEPLYLSFKELLYAFELCLVPVKDIDYIWVNRVSAFKNQVTKPVEGNLSEGVLGYLLSSVKKEPVAGILYDNGRLLAHQVLLQLFKGRASYDVYLIFLVLHDGGNFHILELLCSLILRNTLSGKDFSINNNALDPRRHPKGRILYIPCLFPEDGSQ